MTLLDDRQHTLPPSSPQYPKNIRADVLPHLVHANDRGLGRFLTMMEVATILRCSYETVRSHYKQGILKGHQRQIGCAIRIFESSVIEYLEEQQCPDHANRPASSEFPAKKTGMSETGGKSTAQLLRMRERLNAS